MPLIKGKSRKAMDENVETEMDSGKPQKQAVAIAYAMRRKAQNKAQGGWIEPENLEVADKNHFGNEHDSEPENYQQNLHGTGFKKSNIGEPDIYNTEPQRFAEGGMAYTNDEEYLDSMGGRPDQIKAASDYNKGGMCYAKGGQMHPVDMLMRQKFLSAQKKAYGGPIDPPQMLDEAYPEYEEDNYQMERTPKSAPMRHEASMDPQALGRMYLTRKAVRR